MNKAAAVLRVLVAILLLPLLFVPSSSAWGNEGHRIINRVAFEKLPGDMPAFMRSVAAGNEIEYLGPEPDRWRSPSEPELNAAGAPEHFMDMELADLIGPLPHNRYDYVRKLYAAQIDDPRKAAELAPEKVGFQPYAAIEIQQRLQAAFRMWRSLQDSNHAAHADLNAAEQSAIFYAGWLGHYAGDASMPLHTSINYNGWVESANPNGYTTAHGIHSQFESVYVAANVQDFDVAPLVGQAKVLAHPFDDYVAYMRYSNSLVGRTYQIEKAGGFTGAGSSEAKAFAAERLAAGATMLRDLIYTAWVTSAQAPAASSASPAPASKGPNGV